MRLDRYLPLFEYRLANDFLLTKHAITAFAFRFFELALAYHAEEIEILKKHVMSLTSLLDQAGYNENGYIDFIEETEALFSKLPDMSAEALVEEFNNIEVSSALVVHFRLLAAAYVKTHPEDYMPFIDDGEGTTIEEYCNRQIEAFAVEADHLALSALVNAVGKAELGVVYMDRSAGEDAVVHSFVPMTTTTTMTGEQIKIDLLYRPGHYDIFYR